MTVHEFMERLADRGCVYCGGLGWFAKQRASINQRWTDQVPESVPAEWIEEVCRCVQK